MTRLPRPLYEGPTAALEGTVRTLEDADLHRWAALSWAYCPFRHRHADEPAHLRKPTSKRSSFHAGKGRCGHPRQPRCPQEPGRRGSDPGQRCMAALPAALQPRYQPDRNGLRQAHGAHLRATIDPLWQAIGEIRHLFSPTECRNYFTAAGLDSHESPI